MGVIVSVWVWAWAWMMSRGFGTSDQAGSRNGPSMDPLPHRFWGVALSKKVPPITPPAPPAILATAAGTEAHHFAAAGTV